MPRLRGEAMTHTVPLDEAAMEKATKGPIEILCKEIGFRFLPEMETTALLVSFVRVLVGEIADMRDIQDRIAHVTGKKPSEGSEIVLGNAEAMLRALNIEEMIRLAAEVHNVADRHNPEDKYPTDHLIDMLSSCASAIRFGLEKPCMSRHAASAADHIWKHRYGVSLFDQYTSNWRNDWTRAQLEKAIVTAYLSALPVCAGEWRSMESAPKDGSPIIVLMPATSDLPQRATTGYWQKWEDELGSEYHANGTYLGQYPTGEGFGDTWMTHEGDYETDAPNGPTAWQPLPLPSPLLTAAANQGSR